MSGVEIVIGIAAVAGAIVWFRRLHRPGDQVETDFSPNEIGPDEFPLSVVGESFTNRDGRSRQDIIRRCRPGDSVILVPEPDNPKDRFAVAVVHRLGQIGYLPSGSERVSDELERGKFLSITILNVHGNGQGRSLGVSLRVRKAAPKPKFPKGKAGPSAKKANGV